MRCIHCPPSLPFLPFYMLIVVWDSFHSNSRTYVTISTAYRILYTGIVIANRVHICTWVSLIATRVSYAGCQYQYSCTHSFDIKNNKTRLMDICWALIINYLNCLNLLNLWNCSISLSINRCLGERINQSYLESKVMLVVYLQKSLEQQNLESFGCRGVLVSGVGLYTYLIHYC